MRVFVTIAAAGSVVLTGALAAVAGLFLASSAIAVAGERPSFAVKSFPISAAQVAILGGADMREQAPSSDLTLGGMPASPAQIRVLTPRQQTVASNAGATR